MKTEILKKKSFIPECGGVFRLLLFHFDKPNHICGLCKCNEHLWKWSDEWNTWIMIITMNQKSTPIPRQTCKRRLYHSPKKSQATMYRNKKRRMRQFSGEFRYSNRYLCFWMCFCISIVFPPTLSPHSFDVFIEKELPLKARLHQKMAFRTKNGFGLLILIFRLFWHFLFTFSLLATLQRIRSQQQQ